MKPMKHIKHFFGWLFRYCPYGGTCPPKHPYKFSDEEISKRLTGGGCGGKAYARGKNSVAIPGLSGNATPEEKEVHREMVAKLIRNGGGGC